MQTATARYTFFISTPTKEVVVNEGDTVTVVEHEGSDAYRIEFQGHRALVGKSKLKLQQFANKDEWVAAVQQQGFTVREDEAFNCTYAVDADGKEVGIFHLTKDDYHLFEAVQELECTRAEADAERAKLPDVVRANLFATTEEFWKDAMGSGPDIREG